MNIISRALWRARAWIGQPYPVPMSERTHFLVHYHGGLPRNDRGDANAKEIESIHLSNGWSGIGYNFVVGQDGAIREGRGWGLVGAHCPTKNRTGIGVYVAVGGDQKPTAKALASVKWLYEEATRRAGHRLIYGVHGDYYPTSCAGPVLTPWTHSGMKAGAPTSVTPSPSTPSASKPAKGKIAVDGLLGPATFTAIQKWAGAPVDGVWGPATRKALQKKIGVAADGLFGTKSVKALQKAVGTPVDGIWGTETTKALQTFLNSGPKASTTKPKASTTKPKASTTKGTLAVDGKKGPATIKALQNWVGVSADGIEGPATRKALQKKVGVTQDGIVDTSTIKALQRKVGVSSVDGVWGTETTKALQRYLNKTRR